MKSKKPRKIYSSTLRGPLSEDFKKRSAEKAKIWESLSANEKQQRLANIESILTRLREDEVNLSKKKR